MARAITHKLFAFGPTEKLLEKWEHEWVESWEKGWIKGWSMGWEKGWDKGWDACNIQILRQLLLCQLRMEFGKLPPAIVQTIKSTTDPKQLDRWLDRTFTGSTLEQMRICPHEVTDNSSANTKKTRTFVARRKSHGT